MSIHTILSQMEKEFDKKFNCSGLISCQINPMEAKSFFRSFATRIVEEVGKELIDEWKIQSSEEFWGRFDEYKLITEFSQKLMQRVLQTIEQRTKLQKMKV